MKKINIIKKLQELGLNNSDFSVMRSNPYAYYHINNLINNAWEVYYQGDRGGVSNKREYTSEEEAKKYLIDLVNVQKGNKTVYNIINNSEKFDNEKETILKEIRVEISKLQDIDKLKELEKLLLEFEITNENSKDFIEEYILDNAFSIGENLFHKILFFINSIRLERLE